MRTSGLALAMITLAAIASLFASAVSARAETTGAVAAPDPATEAPASSETTPAPIDVPEPVETPEVTGADSADELAGTPAPSSPEPVATDDPVAVSTPSASDADPVGAVADAAPAAAAEVSLPVHVETEPDAIVPSAVHRVSSLMEGSVKSSPETVASVVENLPKTAASVADDLPRAVAPVSEALDQIASTGKAALLDATDPAADVLATPPAAGGDVGPPSSFSTPSLSEPLPIGSLLGHRVDAPQSLIAKYTAGFGGVESPGLMAPAKSLSDLRGLLSSAVASSRPSDAIQRFNGPSPLDDPGPLPGSPGATVPGSGASPFVPLAALLALLALVTPAILRRFREVPGLPAPTPFICALERPG